MKSFRWMAVLLLLGLFAGGVARLDAQPAPYDANKPPPMMKDKKAPKEDGLRTIQGLVRDASENPIDGAVVQLKNTKTLQVRSFITKADGRYNFSSLASNVDYELRAGHQGAQSDKKTVSVFDSRKLVVLNLKIEPKEKQDKEEKK
jgi:hypothetical protein